jgi:hypothetical protein
MNHHIKQRLPSQTATLIGNFRHELTPQTEILFQTTTSNKTSRTAIANRSFHHKPPSQTETTAINHLLKKIIQKLPP